MTVSLADIRRAARHLAPLVVRTPMVAAPALSALSDAEVYLKLENLQRTGSFKARGAAVKMAGLSATQRRRGVVAASAGNHAQGVAYHARRLGLPATIFMPEGTPFAKIARTEALGADIRMEGATLAQSARAAQAFAKARRRTYIHPYDDPAIIAGQGTVGLEMIEDRPDLDALIVPVGGGGLIAGIACAVRGLRAKVGIHGVQSAAYPSMRAALGGQRPPPRSGTTLAEGIAVKDPGRITRAIVAALVEDILIVEDAAIEKAMLLLLDEAKTVAEGAGAAPLAALLAHRERFRGRKVGLVVSGGNVDRRILSSVLMRGLVREGRLVRLRIGLADSPGSLAEVARLIGEGGGNIVEVHHQRLFQDVPVKMAELDAVVETLDPLHVQRLIERLEAQGHPTRLLGDTGKGE